MRLIIIQISDMHCKSSANQYTKKIRKAADALEKLGKFDGVLFVFNGDLVNSASVNEFKAANAVINSFLRNFSEKLGNKYIPLIIVPGNHDIKIPPDEHRIDEILAWQKNNQEEEHLEQEIENMAGFFEYAHQRGCFIDNNFYDNKILDFSGIKVQTCCLNSAPFSTRRPDDKEAHYLPPYVEDNLERQSGCALKVTVVHHHFEWFKWETKQMLKRMISTDDITFFGHDHEPDELTTKYADGRTYNIIMGGEFNLDAGKDSAFNALVYDSESKTIKRYEFNWKIDGGFFISRDCGNVAARQNELVPSDSFLETLLSDNVKVDSHIKSTEDYYVFPKLTAEGKAFPKSDNIQSATIGEDNIFSALEREKAIRITGSSGFGKTALINHLYVSSVKRGFIPLLIEKGEYANSRIDKMYDAYLQADNNKKIVFIDDVDDIENKKALENLIKNIMDAGKLLVCTATEKNHNLAEIVRNQLAGKETSNLDIWPVYKETRDAIVEKIGKKCGKSSDEIDDIIAVLDYASQCHPAMFSLTPGTTLQYVKCFLNGGIKEGRDIQTISVVFETNIRASLFSVVSNTKAAIYLTALEYIADEMYFSLRVESISMEKLGSLVNEYNVKRRANVNSVEFLDRCREASILKPMEGGMIAFYDNNTYAYFVAKALNREYENDQGNKDKLLKVMNQICFGINDTIILFLSFIRSNKRFVLKIANEALELLKDTQAWDIDANNLPFLRSAKMKVSAPTPEEKKETHQTIERVEKAKHDSIKFRGIFDYDENDVTKHSYVITRALKYTQLVGRALVDQYGSLDQEDLDTILDTLYNAPQKIIYSILSPIQQHSDEIVKSIVDYFDQNYPAKKITEDKVQKTLGMSGTYLALNILNDIAFNSANRSTIIALREGPSENSNHNLLRFMMEENADSTEDFVQKAISYRADCEKKPYLKMLIAQVVRKHIIFHSDIKSRQINKLISGKVFSKKGKAQILLTKEAGKKS